MRLALAGWLCAGSRAAAAAMRRGPGRPSRRPSLSGGLLADVQEFEAERRRLDRLNPAADASSPDGLAGLACRHASELSLNQGGHFVARPAAPGAYSRSPSDRFWPRRLLRF